MFTDSAISSECSDEDLIPASYYWIRFKWVLFKDSCKHWQNISVFLFVLLMPSICCLVVVVLRCQISGQHITASNFPVTDIEDSWQKLLNIIEKRQERLQEYYGRPTHSSLAPRIIIAFAPDLQPIRNIMNRVYDNFTLRGNDYVTFSTCHELRKKMSTEHYLAGICFDETNFHTESESVFKVGIYPNRLKYNIIFPSELRIYRLYLGNFWQTFTLYGRKRYHERAHGFENYIKDGFIMIQKKISEAYIDLITERNNSISDVVNIRRFPVAEHYYDRLMHVLEKRLSLFLVLAYIPCILYFLWNLVHERETKLDKLLEIMDVTPFIQFYSWFVFTLASMTLSTVILLFILKIPWNQGFSVFSRSSFTCLFALFTAFNINALSFCFMLSKFFRNAILAASAAPILWIVFYVPYHLIVHPNINFTLTSLLGNTAFGRAMETTFKLEHYNGINWLNLFKHDDLLRYHFSVGIYGVIMCGVSIIQVLVGIYVSRLNPTFSKVLKLFKRHKKQTQANVEGTRYSKTIILEVRAAYKPPLLEVKTVTVERGDNKVLDDISFSLYEDEITVLMGHNGCGKTTLLEVICGFRKPTSGKVVIQESTEKKDFGCSRDFVGVCFGDSMLFDQLSVKRQLTLFGKLKGLHSTEVKREVKKYLNALELDDEWYKRTEGLTLAQRSKLAVGCALIGGSKIVLLDDVTLKLDVRDYQLVWRLLEKEKFDRCIIVASNLSLEPELHADNVIMLAQGRLKCTGTAQFLKSMYCFGFHLLFFSIDYKYRKNQTIGTNFLNNSILIPSCGYVLLLKYFSLISKSERCNTEDVTKLLSKFLPEITLASDLAREIIYHIETTDIEIIETAFRKLETAKQRLNIINISIIEMPMEELFCKLGAERPAYDDRKRYSRIFGGHSITLESTDDDLLFMKTPRQYQIKAFQNTFNQWYAMFYKSCVFSWTKKLSYPILVFMLFFFISFGAREIVEVDHISPKLKLDISDYEHSVTLLSVRKDMKPSTKNFEEIYKQFIYWRSSNIKMIDIEGESISDYIFNQQRQNQYNNLNLKVILGLSIHKHFTAWYNGYLPHVAPLSLNILHNAMLRFLLQTSEAKITVSIELLPKENSSLIFGFTRESLNVFDKLAILFSLILCYLISSKVFILVTDRSTGFLNIQQMAGLRGFNYWITNFLIDLLKIFILVVIFIFVIWLLIPQHYVPENCLREYFFLLLPAGVALTSSNYFLSIFFNNAHKAYLIITSLQSIGIASFIILTRTCKDFSAPKTFILRIFPLYTFCSEVQNIYKHFLKTRSCEIEPIKAASLTFDECKHLPKCCEEIEIEPHIRDLWIIIAISWCGIWIQECKDFFTHIIPFDHFERALDEHIRRHAKDSVEVDSVTAEAVKVMTMKPRMRNYYTVICDRLGLIKKGKILVDRLSFTIKPGEIFGIIGTNSKCTDALLNLLAGLQRPTFGRSIINTVSMADERQKALAHVGYVPANNCVMLEMTCYQILKMFCILYAYPHKQIDDICDNLSQQFGFHSHYNVRLKRCSLGIRERISYSIAFLKKPAFLCIGIYGWSVDPHGRRQLYRLLDALCKQGTAVAMTAAMNYLTENLYTKIAVMQDGQILHVGQPSRIAAELANGYFIAMRLKKPAQTRQGITTKVFFRLTSFMEKNFPSSILVQESAIMHFYIPRHNTNLSALFKILRLNSFQLSIESFSISTINMSYVFGLITEEVMRS